MIVALVALIAAMSGSAVALRGQDTVRSDDIKDGHVRAADIAPRAVDEDIAAAVEGQGPIAVQPTTVDSEGDVNPCDEGVSGVFCGVWHVNLQATLGWTNYGEPVAPVEFFKDASGVVHISGTVAPLDPITPPFTYFVLPPSFRPAAIHYFDVRCFRQSGYGTLSEETGSYRVEIGPDGAVNPSGVTADDNCDYRPLDGISFHAGS